MATFYVLFSPLLNKHYVGHTTEPITERLRKHLAAHKGWTARTKDWAVVHCEHYPTKSQAYARELEVKRWKSRARIEELVGPAP